MGRVSSTKGTGYVLQPYLNCLWFKEKSGARWSEITREVEVVLQGTFAGSLDPTAALWNNTMNQLLV